MRMAEMGKLSLVVVLAALVTVEAATTIFEIGPNSNDCGSQLRIAKDSEYRLVTTGDSPVTNCQFEFTADMVDNCMGLCYMFDPNAMFRDPKVRVIVTSTSSQVIYDMSYMNTKPVCSEDKSITINLQQDKEYKYDAKHVGYRFTLEVYNKCGPRGNTSSITFEEALKNLDGYHHGEDRETRERNNYVSGILLGFGLACIFLVVLLIGYCYVRNSPNRGPNRSVGMPKVGGFKKNLKPNKEQPSGTEMGVRYTATGEGKSEAKPLLTETTSDPEKPPEETHVVSVDEGK